MRNSQLRDLVYIHSWKVELLKDEWEGPYFILLTMYTAVMGKRISFWIHCTRAKPGPLPETKDEWRAVSAGLSKTMLPHKHDMK